MLKRTPALLVASVALALSQAPGHAEERIDYEINARIRKEGRDHSQIMRTVHVLTDVYGPRLTGSPNHKAAAEWVIKQMTEWGFENAHLEPWDFGHPGWANERASGFIVSPVKDSLVLEVLAWTPGTKGTVTARAVQITPPACPTPGAASVSSTRSERTEGPARTEGTPRAEGAARPDGPKCPTQEELTKYFDGVRAEVKGKMVLVGRHTAVPVSFNPPSLRRDDESVRAQLENPALAYQPPRSSEAASAADGGPVRLTGVQIAEQLDAFLLASGAIVRVNDAGRDHGQIRAFNNRSFDPAKVVPTVIVRNEDYGRISRLLADKTPVELEFNIVNHVYPEGKTSYNVVAEIKGTDKADEVVMLGGHLDSWHAATGATDNAVGCAVMMEAARILKTIGVKPRRTIRVALWSGEEQGLLGSKAYVKEHYGTAEAPKAEFEKFNGYFNVDSGTGRIRSASIFGPSAAAAVLREAFAPFEDFGMLGAGATRSRRSGGTDSTSFNEAGLPGIGLGQDPIQYQSYTWHTNLDTYERIVEDDVKRSAMAIAAAVYHVAMRDDMLPRFTKDQMPASSAPTRPVPAAPTTSPSASR
jgi:carboxypeptidase Q